MLTEMESTPNKRQKLESESSSPESSKSDSESRDSTTSATSGVSQENTPDPSLVPLLKGDSLISLGQSSSTDHSVLATGSSNHLPEKLSNWNRKNIEDLNIKIAFEPKTTPFDLLTEKSWNGKRKGMGFPVNFSIFEAEEKQNRKAEEDQKIKRLIGFVKSSGFLKMIEGLEYSSFEEFNITTLQRLRSFIKQSYIPYIPKYLPGELDEWFQRFNIEVKNFIKILSRLVENVIKGVPNLEYVFQHLFDAFVKIFGMHSGISFEPNLHVQTLEIGETEVKGSPDIIFYHHRIKEREVTRLEKYVVAVCEVKKDKPLPTQDSSSPPSSKTRRKSDPAEVSSTSVQDVHKDRLQISEKLIGQHCGELLFKFGESIHCNSVFGMVVQQTCVTVTELGMTDVQYLKLKEGRFKHTDGDRPSFTFTKPYNFLKVEELEKLLEPFIKFGLEQGE